MGQLAARNFTEEVEKGATFLPDDDWARMEFLLAESGALRRSNLVALNLQLAARAPVLWQRSPAFHWLDWFANLTATEQQTIVEYPATMIWLRQASQAFRGHIATGAVSPQLDYLLAELPLVTERALTYSADSSRTRLGGAIEVQRFEVDPLVSAVAPPTYTFPTAKETLKQEPSTAYSLPFFAEVATVAFDRIAATWAELSELLPRFVKTIVHVPDGTFRSGSASRYTGVIFLTADDDNILDLEESTVHEFGHQILYRVMELDPLITDNKESEYRLPWSGAERDFYGYFHAFYIYILLALYYERVIDRGGDERTRAYNRRAEIIRGLDAALADFASDARYTSTGAVFSESLARKVRALVDSQVPAGVKTE